MTSQSGHGLLRALTPFPSDHPFKASQAVPRRAKRSNACAACRARKSKRDLQSKSLTNTATIRQDYCGVDIGDSGQLRSLISTAKELRLRQANEDASTKTLRRPRHGEC
ncbi:uncharacterized protein BDW70DRAFT_144619 [Aspergillus foveolatus]|uniref:uncharacterized protein n=1 Tax=Aspergillus foveolatus TaxID=210207 RepID=UPI003CCE2D51